MSTNSVPMGIDNFDDAIFQVSDLTRQTSRTAFTLDIDMVRLLLSLNGEKTVAQIARDMRVPSEQCRQGAETLAKMGLIETHIDTSKVLDASFFESLSATMTRMVGPVGPILIEEAITDLGLDRTCFSTKYGAVLVNALSAEIYPEGKRLAFQKCIMEILNKRIS